MFKWSIGCAGTRTKPCVADQPDQVIAEFQTDTSQQQTYIDTRTVQHGDADS